MRAIISRYAPAPTGYLHLGHVVNAIYVWRATDCSGARRHTGARGFSRAAREIRYPGTCRDRNLADGPGMSLRVRVEPTVERFVDLRHGPQEQGPSEQCGDLLIRDREGNWTYQFAATVDDFAQGVTHVIRGDDLLESTGRQIALARRLGRADPARFLHHPLLMKSASQKISRSDGDTGVRELRARGRTPENVIGLAAEQAGLTPSTRAVRAADVSSIMAGTIGPREPAWP
ncbi:MAG TPA: glutamate--tRNA ligase family protein [Vicinamibacterales bacterium]